SRTATNMNEGDERPLADAAPDHGHIMSRAQPLDLHVGGATGGASPPPVEARRTACRRGRQLQRHYDVRLGVADPADALDLGPHGLRQRRVALNLDIGEDVGLPPTRVSLLHTGNRAQRRYDRLVFAGFDRYEYIGRNHLPFLRYQFESTPAGHRAR